MAASMPQASCYRWQAGHLRPLYLARTRHASGCYLGNFPSMPAKALVKLIIIKMTARA